jgi:hypothetical protein
MSEDNAARLLTEAERLTGHANGAAAEATGPRRPIWEVIQELMADVRPEELAKIPPSSDIGHVVYGLPKPE